MLESALLLDPNQPDVHLQAAHVGALLVQRLYRGFYTRPEDSVTMAKLFRRTTEHMEIGARPDAKRVPPKVPVTICRDASKTLNLTGERPGLR